MPKILIVDDDQDVVRILKDHLQHAGYDISVAVDGVEGVRKATDENPDLILLDVMMPHMDGLTALQNLNFDNQTERIPVIVITAKGPQMKDVFKMEGAAAYVTKPFVFKELLQLIQQHIRQ